LDQLIVAERDFANLSLPTVTNKVMLLHMGSIWYFVKMKKSSRDHRGTTQKTIGKIAYGTTAFKWPGALCFFSCLPPPVCFRLATNQTFRQNLQLDSNLQEVPSKTAHVGSPGGARSLGCAINSSLDEIAETYFTFSPVLRVVYSAMLNELALYTCDLPTANP
jgi:hypothetical protein